MDKSFVPGQSSQSNNIVPGQAQNPNARPTNSKRPSFRRSKIAKLLVGLLALVLLVVGVHYIYKHNTQALIDKNAYQAVFLTNGQVYFGKLHQGHDDYLTMTDIYYLQVQEAQPAGEAVKDKATNPQDIANADTQLIKLGEELHAPKDAMTINKDQILFWEDLKDSGKVAQAIKDYKAKK